MSTSLQKQQQLITRLLDPKYFPHPVKKVQLIETHISWVLLAGHFAYKIKKALDLEFLNTTRLAARKKFCNEEIRLNRRLAPQLYLDVVPIGGSSSKPILHAEPAFEYAVRMRRFPIQNTLDHLADQHKISISHIEKLASLLAQFHQDLPQEKRASNNAFVATTHQALQQSVQQLSLLMATNKESDHLLELQRTLEVAFSALFPMIARRYEQGFVRECHGDLHLGNLALIRGELTPFDGIDFSPALRHIDVIDEIAFLFMDLLFHQQAALAYRLLNTYLEETGDYTGLALLDFYTANRALVRAKIVAIRTAQSHSPFQAECNDYLKLGISQLQQREPTLIIMHGLPGAGKSYFAAQAADHLQAIRIRSDIERKRLFGLTAHESSKALKIDIYTPEATQLTYERLHQLTREILNTGYSVIVDAAFLKKAERDKFKQLAKELNKRFLIISVEATEGRLRSRINQRIANKADASEADSAVLDQLKQVQEPISKSEMSYTYRYQNNDNHQLSESTWISLHHYLKPPK